MSNEKECFVIGPIGEPGSGIRERSDNVLEYVIEDAIEEYGYTAVRADDISEPGIITTQIIERIMQCPLVIADLTDHNPNVFYELAVRHAARRPVIQLIESEQEIPFDIANTRTVHFTLSDVEAYETAKTEIKNQIENIEEGDDEVDNPVSVANDLHILRDSDDPQQENMAEVVESVNSVYAEVKNIENLLKEQEKTVTPELYTKLHDTKELLNSLETEFSGLGDALWVEMNEEEKDVYNNVDEKIKYLKDYIDDMQLLLQQDVEKLSDFV
jgi:hypothetical protein